MQLKFGKRIIIRSFCVHILLPVSSLFILFYLFTLLNGSHISPIYQSVISVVLGTLFLGLIYSVIKGFNNFFQVLLSYLKDLHTASLDQTSEQKDFIIQQNYPVLQPNSQKRSLKWVLILAGSAIVITSFLNPSYQDFKEFAPERKTQGHYAEWKRAKNYLIFSVYEKDIYEREYVEDDFSLVSSQKFIGFLKNFAAD